jgi:flagellar protein FlaG
LSFERAAIIGTEKLAPFPSLVYQKAPAVGVCPARDGRAQKEQGGTMGMPISSVGNGAISPAYNHPGIPLKTAEHRAVADKVIASLPGNNSKVETTHQDLRKIASDISHVSLAFNKKLQFVVDHQSNEVIVKVIDKETDKVIKVIPPEELRRLHRMIKETIGFLFNEEV